MWTTSAAEAAGDVDWDNLPYVFFLAQLQRLLKEYHGRKKKPIGIVVNVSICSALC